MICYNSLFEVLLFFYVYSGALCMGSIVLGILLQRRKQNKKCPKCKKNNVMTSVSEQCWGCDDQEKQ